MAIKNKEALKKLFKSGSVPTQKDFSDLIDSVLIKRNDQFFGLWNSGVAYRPGDVVLYGKSIYKLEAKEEMTKENAAEEGTAETDTEATPKFAAQLPPEGEESETEVEDVSICSTICPPDDPRWCLLKLDIDDNDWKILEEGEEGIMYAMVYGRIGMGTTEPTGRVDMLEVDKGQFVFNPSDNDAASTKLTSLSASCPGNYLANEINADYTEWSTNVPIGYVFKKAAAIEKEKGESTKEDPEDEAPAMDLMLITASEDGTPMIGVGTLEPEAMIDLEEPELRQIHINPSKNKLPEIIWLNLDPGSDKNFMSAKVNLRNAVMTTNADNGYQFNIGPDYESYCKDEEDDESKTVLSIRETGKVGIGTENPMAQLQITNQESGDIRVNVDHDNPSISIINLRPKTMDNYLTMGADNDHGVFVSDAPNGFVFKAGEKSGNENEENINQGEKLMYIHPEGKVGIGIHPNEYELDVFGKIRSASLHLDTDSSKIMRTGDLENVLPDLCKLNAIKFKWDAKKTNVGEEGEQIGFFANQVGEYFPELVKTHADATKSVAYQNMVAVLTQAIKEQQSIIEDLKKRVSALEDGTD